jgi:Exostosin family
MKKPPARPLLTFAIVGFIAGLAIFTLDLTSYKQGFSVVVKDRRFAHLFDNLIQELSNSSYSYYVYDNPNLTLPGIRENARKGIFTWRKRWGHRYKEYALWELEYLKALEGHRMRTYNAHEADFIVVPIPTTAIVVAGKPSRDMRHALDTLYDESLFQRHPEKHVLFSFLEFLFNPFGGDAAQLVSGILPSDYQQLRPITAALFQDYHAWLLQVPETVKEKYGWGLKSTPQPFTSHGFSISLMGSSMDYFKPSEIPRSLTLKQFRNKTYYFFYHTTGQASLNNSTEFRHALVKDNTTALQLPYPSSIGFDIPLDEWKQAFYDSKFCPCIRGDNPQTRCLWRSIRAGCIPLVISDMWPLYAPIYKSFLNMNNYAIMVDEEQFLQNPGAALLRVTNLTNDDLQAKIDGLNLVRRLILPNMPDSLFVEAFARETVASQKDDYYP